MKRMKLVSDRLSGLDLTLGLLRRPFQLGPHSEMIAREFTRKLKGKPGHKRARGLVKNHVAFQHCG